MNATSNKQQGKCTLIGIDLRALRVGFIDLPSVDQTMRPPRWTARSLRGTQLSVSERLSPMRTSIETLRKFGGARGTHDGESQVHRGENHEFRSAGGPCGLANPPRVASFTNKLNHNIIDDTLQARMMKCIMQDMEHGRVYLTRRDDEARRIILRARFLKVIKVCLKYVRENACK